MTATFYSSDRGPLQGSVAAAAARLLSRWVPREAGTDARKRRGDEARAPRLLRQPPRAADGTHTPRPTGAQHRASPPSPPGERRSTCRHRPFPSRSFVPARHQPARRPSAQAGPAARPPRSPRPPFPLSRSPPTGAAAARHRRRGHDAATRRPRSSLPRGARPRGRTPGPPCAPRPCARRRKMAAGQSGAPRHPHPASRSPDGQQLVEQVGGGGQQRAARQVQRLLPPRVGAQRRHGAARPRARQREGDQLAPIERGRRLLGPRAPAQRQAAVAAQVRHAGARRRQPDSPQHAAPGHRIPRSDPAGPAPRSPARPGGSAGCRPPPALAARLRGAGGGAPSGLRGAPAALSAGTRLPGAEPSPARRARLGGAPHGSARGDALLCSSLRSGASCASPWLG